MEKKNTRKDIRASIDAKKQADEILSALDQPAADLNERKTFPQDFSASGSGKGGTGNSASIEN